jgi:hypothetical protein
MVLVDNVHVSKKVLGLRAVYSCAAGSTDVEVSWVELNRKMMDPVMAQRSVHEQQMVVLSRELQSSLMGGSMLIGSGGVGGGMGRGSRGGEDEIEDRVVDLTPYMNTSAFVVSIVVSGRSRANG